MARIFTREEFYELVWSKPMTHLAKEFSISDVALHKICKRHGVPNPPLGWWAKAAAGKKVKRTPLPPAAPGKSGAITIAANDLARQSTSVAAVREQARITASASIEDPATPQPTVIATIAKLRKTKPSENGLVAIDGANLIKCEVGPDSIDRLTDLLPKIIQAAALQGFAIASKGAVSPTATSL